MNNGTAEFTEVSTSRRIEAYGTTIHYHDVGQGEPLVMLHAWGPGSTAWSLFSKILPTLATTFRCIAIDMPNYGSTGPLYRDESIYFMQANAARAVMSALGLESANFLGHSQGGQSALTFATLYPEAVRRLVIGGHHTGASGGEYLFGLGDEEGIRVAYPAFEDPTPENMRRYAELCVADRSLITDALVAYLIEHYTARPDITAAHLKMQYGPRHDLGVLMPDLQIPTLVMWGRDDRTCGWEIGVRIFNMIPDAQLVVMKSAGHWLPFEKPHEYAAHAMAFLAQDRSGSARSET